MLPEAEEWIAQAEYDIETARVMYQGGRYLYTLFMCHLATEKALKAYVVERTGQTPPRTHDLLILMQKGDPPLAENYREFVGSMNVMGIATRYPEDLSRALKKYSQDVAREFLNQTREVLVCLKRGLLTP